MPVMTPDMTGVKPHWSAVDAYFANHLPPADPALEAALQASTDAGLPAISVSPLQGKLLHILALTIGARSILEIGTLGGYSTIWLARALPAGGRLITLEMSPEHAEVARSNLDRAGLSGSVEIRLGKAMDLLTAMPAGRDHAFDLVFIDADKTNTAPYFEQALRLTRPGSLIVVDNVARKGDVIDADSADVDVLGMRRFMEALTGETRVTATAIQTVGSKGYDGFVLARVN